MITASDVLQTWFDTDDATAVHEPRMDRWFKRDDAFDSALRERFGEAIDAGARGAWSAWENSPDGALALVVLLDQFSRNVHRDSAHAYAADPTARAVAERAISRGDHRRVSWLARSFFYLPFEHTESLDAQDRSVALFTSLAAEAPAGFEQLAASFVDYAEKHRAIIARFGRFPHRNAELRRESTAEEQEFLKSGRGF